MKLFCDSCSYETRTINKTLYGEYLCDECWYDYLCTDRGRAEYFVGIAVGDYTAWEFDAEFLGEMITQWYKHKHLFKISESLINIYEMLIFELFGRVSVSEDHIRVVDALRAMAKEMQ